jgi:uncharacterized protein with LGFP repeats
LSFDLWSGSFKTIDTKADPDCPVCAKAVYELLGQAADGPAAAAAATGPDATEVATAATAATAAFTVVSLCTPGNFQVAPATPADLDIAALAQRLSVLGAVVHNPYLLRMDGEGVSLTLFKDGRAVIRGVDGEAGARAVYARYIGM